MRHRWLVALVALALALVPAGSAAAPDTDAIRVQIKPQATLVEPGSIQVSVRIKCAPFGEHFESNITITQDDGALFAQPGLPIVVCDNAWHTVTVTATPFDGQFHRGRAFASAFVSRIDPETGETRQGQDVRTIRVR